MCVCGRVLSCEMLSVLLWICRLDICEIVVKGVNIEFKVQHRLSIIDRSRNWCSNGGDTSKGAGGTVHELLEAHVRSLWAVSGDYLQR